jgi:D-sedoheptulose 7-phosphate isomerase
MSDYQFIKSYLEDLSSTIKPNEEIINKLIRVRDLLLEVTDNNRKILIFGNGGSAAIASHFSVDLTKNAQLRCLNFNEAGLITCFANDYGFERWVEKAIDFYGDEGDLLIVISSSGSSVNMLNGVKAARNANFNSVVTLSGFSQDNPLNQLGDVNLWIDSKAYNFVENIHQIWLLAIVDLVIGKREYSA